MCKGTIKKEDKVKEDKPIVDDQGDFKNFKICPMMIKKLEERGVKALFPIQYMTFKHIYGKKDVIAQAKTGTGKTLGFSLPVMQRLQKKVTKLEKGRKPKVLVMAPTRELVSQIARDFETLIWTDMKVLSIYGGVPYHKQQDVLRSGVDVIVGAPGRMRDLINQGHLNLSEVKYVILDEVDRMLDMGFQDIVDEILSCLYCEEKRPQTLLFSATMPDWIESMTKNYLKPDAVKVCLVKSNDSKAASTVEHLCLLSQWQERSTTIADCIRVYGGAGAQSRCIVFCERKKDADELAAHNDMSSDCHVLHGDVPQEKRELVLAKFREGKYNTLVTTNVSARGLDIPDVDLVIQCHPPKDVEDYIHRSGRTGRAGRSGVCICFYTAKEKFDLTRVENKAGFTFKRITAPSPSAIVGASMADTEAQLSAIPESASAMFVSGAVALIAKFGAELALAKALAKIAGKVEEQRAKSVLTGKEGMTTYIMTAADPIQFKGYVYTNLKKCLPETVVEGVKAVQFVKGRCALVFDLATEHDELVTKDWKDNKHHQLSKCTNVPELEESEARETGYGKDKAGWGNRRGGGNGGFGGGDRSGGFGGGNRSGGGFKRKNEGGFGNGPSKMIKFE